MVKSKPKAARAPKYSTSIRESRQRARVAYRERRVLFKVYMDESLAAAVESAKTRAGVDTNIALLRALLP